MNSTETIESLNLKEARVYFGFVGFISVIFLPAVIGNIHILHIYIRKKKQNNTRVYVCFIAVLDMINCTICYPYMVVNCMLPFMFYSDVACKLFTFITYFTNVCVSWSLLVISVDRFRVICGPFGAQISLKMSQGLCVLATVLAIVCSAPSVLIAETIPIETGVDGIVGRECNSAFNERTWTKVYIALLSIFTILGAVALIVLYSLMGIALRKQEKLIRQSGMVVNSVSSPDTEITSERRRTWSNSSRLYSENEYNYPTITDKDEYSRSNDQNANTPNYDQIEHENTSYSVREKKVSFGDKKPSLVPEESKDITRRHSYSIGDKREFNTSNNVKLFKSYSVAAFDLNNNVPFAMNGWKIRESLGSNVKNSDKVTCETGFNSLTDMEAGEAIENQVRLSTSGRYEKSNGKNSYDGIKHKQSITRRIKRYIKHGSTVLRRSKKRQDPEQERFKRTKRTTIMFFWVTFVFIVSYLPNPALRVARYLYPEWYEGLGLTEMIVYNLFHGSIFLVSATNFFIYLFCDSNFRHEVKQWYKMVFCGRKKNKTES